MITSGLNPPEFDISRQNPILKVKVCQNFRYRNNMTEVNKNPSIFLKKNPTKKVPLLD